MKIPRSTVGAKKKNTTVGGFFATQYVYVTALIQPPHTKLLYDVIVQTGRYANIMQLFTKNLGSDYLFTKIVKSCRSGKFSEFFQKFA